MMRLTFAILIVLTACEVALGQATRPDSNGPGAVSASWERQVSSFAAAAAGRDYDSLVMTLPDKCLIHRFNGERDADTSDLIDFLNGSTVLGDHAYFCPANNAAADIAQDVGDSEVVSDAAKKALALDEKNGSAVALRWITQTLGTEDGTPIGVIVLWTARPDLDNRLRPVFVLIKGIKSDDGFRIGLVVYGDPLQ
jgi:hypothetical protein